MTSRLCVATVARAGGPPVRGRSSTRGNLNAPSGPKTRVARVSTVRCRPGSDWLWHQVVTAGHIWSVGGLGPTGRGAAGSVVFRGGGAASMTSCTTPAARAVDIAMRSAARMYCDLVRVVQVLSIMGFVWSNSWRSLSPLFMSALACSDVLLVLLVAFLRKRQVMSQVNRLRQPLPHDWLDMACVLLVTDVMAMLGNLALPLVALRFPFVYMCVYASYFRCGTEGPWLNSEDMSVLQLARLRCLCTMSWVGPRLPLLLAEVLVCGALVWGVCAPAGGLGPRPKTLHGGMVLSALVSVRRGL